MINKLENKKVINNIYVLSNLKDIYSQIKSDILYIDENGVKLNNNSNIHKINVLLSSYTNKSIFIVIKISNNFSIDIQKKIIFNIIKIFNICNKKNIDIGSIIDGINIKCAIIYENINFDYSNIINSIQALLLANKRLQYEFIYDVVCKQLDEQFALNNYCDFKCDKCIASRANRTFHKTMGCCYSFDYSIWKGANNVQLCKYLSNNKCTINCMACKLFTCKFLKEKGIRYKTNDIPLLTCFFNKKQREILSANFFVDKPKIIDKLLEKNHTPYPLYYLFDCCRIKNK